MWKTIPERVDPFATSYTAEGLKPYTAYQFRIRATNDIGPSGYSNATETVRTLPAGKLTRWYLNCGEKLLLLPDYVTLLLSVLTSFYSR